MNLPSSISSSLDLAEIQEKAGWRDCIIGMFVINSHRSTSVHKICTRNGYIIFLKRQLFKTGTEISKQNAYQWVRSPFESKRQKFKYCNDKCIKIKVLLQQFIIYSDFQANKANYNTVLHKIPTFTKIIKAKLKSLYIWHNLIEHCTVDTYWQRRKWYF